VPQVVVGEFLFVLFGEDQRLLVRLSLSELHHVNDLLDWVFQFEQQVNVVLDLLQIFLAVLVLIPTDVLDDTSLDEGQPVLLDELYRLDRHVLVVAAADLNVFS
jgi:hypothetical protein